MGRATQRHPLPGQLWALGVGRRYQRGFSIVGNAAIIHRFMGKIADPRVVFRTASAEKVDAAWALLEGVGIPLALRSGLEEDVLVEEGEEVREGLSHTLWVSAAQAEAAADALRAGGFAAAVEPPDRPPRRRGELLAYLVVWVVAFGALGWMLVVLSERF